MSILALLSNYDQENCLINVQGLFAFSSLPPSPPPSPPLSLVSGYKSNRINWLSESSKLFS